MMVEDLKAARRELNHEGSGGGLPRGGTALVVGNFFMQGSRYGSVGHDIAQRLSPRGWNMIVTSRKQGKVVKVLDMVSTAWRRRRDYSVAQIEVFSGAAFFWAEATAAVLRRAGKPYVLTLHGGELPRFAARWPRRVQRLLLSADEVTSPSRYLSESLKALRPGIRVIPNGIEIARYPFRERRKCAPQLVWLRAFHDIYNPTLAVAVMKRLVAAWPDAVLRMVGPDKGDGSLQATRKLCEEQGLADRFQFVGPVPRESVPATLASADIFLNTTNADNNPVSVIEAMACGLCVVSTDAGGLPFLLDHEKDGLLVSRGDDQGMATAADRVLRDPELANRLSVSARRKVEGFDWGRVIPQWVELFSRLSQRGTVS